MFVRVFGMEKVLARFKTLAGGPSKSVMEEVARRSKKAVQSNFSGNPLGWRPLKPSTIKKKGHSRILIGTSSKHMRDDIKVEVGKDRIDMSSNKLYGVIHQKGARKNHPPKRAWMVIQKKWEKQIFQPVADWLGGRRT